MAKVLAYRQLSVNYFQHPLLLFISQHRDDFRIHDYYRRYKKPKLVPRLRREKHSD